MEIYLWIGSCVLAPVIPLTVACLMICAGAMLKHLHTWQTLTQLGYSLHLVGVLANHLGSKTCDLFTALIVLAMSSWSIFAPQWLFFSVRPGLRVRVKDATSVCYPVPFIASSAAPLVTILCRAQG